MTENAGKPRKVILYIALSVDGYIAGPGDDLSFLKAAEAPGEDYGYAAFTAGTDTLVTGRRTYDWVTREVGEFPEKERQVFILTRTARPPEGNITFYTGGPAALVRQILGRPGKHIHLDGGAQVVGSFLADRLVDEMRLFLIPVLLGGGIRLFPDKQSSTLLRLLASRTFPTGVTELHYQVLGPPEKPGAEPL